MKVGMLVSDAVRVAVWVGKMIGVNVAGGVELDEGGGLVVHVGMVVGVMGTIRLKPPHAMRNRVRIAIPINVLYKRLQWMIQVPENP